MPFYHILLAGGLGKRIWPISNSNSPKQFIKFAKHSFFQKNLLRHNMPDIKAHYAVINQSDFLLAQSQVLELNQQMNYIVEPIRRNTAAACLLAALAIHQRDNEAILCITPSDHFLADVAQYHEILQLAYKQSKTHNQFVLLGAQPLYPSMDYGYLKYKAKDNICDEITAFIEKPDKLKANAIHTDMLSLISPHENYRWNMGIFIIPAAEFIAQFAKRDANMLQQCQHALAKAVTITQPNTISIHTKDMQAIESASIDQHFFTHCNNLKLLHYHGNWGDIGTWPGFMKHVPSHASHLAAESANCHFYSEANKNIFALGVKDLCLLDTEAGIFLTNKTHLEQMPDAIKHWQQVLNNINNPEPTKNSKKNNIIETPWGTSEVLSYFANYKVKILTIMPNAKISLQYHIHRSEHWFVIVGQAEAIINSETIALQQGAHLFIPQQAPHRVHNTGDMPLQILEVQLGNYLAEEDIVRLEDQYGRV